MTGALLTVEDLTVEYPVGRRGVVRAVDGVGFEVAAGQTLAIIGESGSGKSTIAKALLRLVPAASGRIVFDDLPWDRMRGAALRHVRRRLQIVSQDSTSTLDPRWTAHTAIAEPLVVNGVPRAEAAERAAEMFARVGLTTDLLSRFPHQLSGGQRQRVNIARSLVLNPKLVVCDEAVSALDVSLQAEIVNLLIDLRAEYNLTYVFITHDIGLLPHLADSVAVLYLGQIVEAGPVRSIIAEPRHPYTIGLLTSVPRVRAERTRDATPAARGEIPDPTALPSGCRFHPRCPVAMPLCSTTEPPLRRFADGRSVACHLAGDPHDPSGHDLADADSAARPGKGDS